MSDIAGTVKRENAVGRLSAQEAAECAAYAEDYVGYLGIAKTERRAYAEAVRRIEALGFRELSTFETLKPGDKVYRGYHGKTLMAAVIGQEPVANGINVIGGHTDAPRIDLKPVPICEKGGLAYFDTHYYGGIKKFHWLVHPLALYGVIVKPDGTKVEVAIGDEPGDPVFQITDILPHFGAEQSGKKVSEAFDPEDMDVLIGSAPEPGADKDAKETVKRNILRLLAERYGVTEEDFLSAELELVPAGMPRDLGLDRSMITGYGHDDRVCAYAGLRALMDLPAAPRRTGMVLLCDKEEIGSVGATGMDSTFRQHGQDERRRLPHQVHRRPRQERRLRRPRRVHRRPPPHLRQGGRGVAGRRAGPLREGRRRHHRPLPRPLRDGRGRLRRAAVQHARAVGDRLQARLLHDLPRLSRVPGRLSPTREPPCPNACC